MRAAGGTRARRSAGLADRRARRSPSSAPRSRPATSSPGGRPGPCSAGRCWCRAPASRPARCRRCCARTARRPLEVPTIAVEQPRTPAPMERAVKGLISGRYQWIAFTSTNAVQGGTRALRGVRPRRPGVRRRPGRRGRRGHRRGARRLGHHARSWCRPAQQSSEGLLADWPPYDDVLDPIDRVLLPRADIATETLVAGLLELRLAGRRRDRLPHRARRAAARADPRGAEGRRGRRRAVHVVLDRAQPGRHRRQAARVDRHRRHRPADRRRRCAIRACGSTSSRASRTCRRSSRRWREFALERRRAGGQGRRQRREGRDASARTAQEVTGPLRQLRDAAAVPGQPPAPAAPDGGAAPADRGGPARPGRAGPADVRQGRHQRAGADQLDARRRPAHPRVAAQGRGRGGERRGRRPDPVRDPGAQGRAGLVGRRSAGHRPAGAAATWRARSATQIVLMADLCLDEYTDHGHCGLLTADGEVDNDATLERYALDRRRAGRSGRPRGRAQRDDGRPGRRDPRRRWTTPARTRSPSSRTRRSMRARSTGRSGRRPSARRSSVTGRPTSRTRRVRSTRRCARSRSTSPRAPTPSW